MKKITKGVLALAATFGLIFGGGAVSTLTAEPAHAGQFTQIQNLSPDGRYVTVVMNTGRYVALPYGARTVQGAMRVEVPRGSCVTGNWGGRVCNPWGRASSAFLSVPLAGIYSVKATNY